MSDLPTATYTRKYDFNFDKGGRITVPSEWRADQFPKLLVAWPSANVKTNQPCISVHPMSTLTNLLQRMKKLDLTNSERIEFQELAEDVQELTWDDQGRIMVDEALRNHAQIEKKAIMAGRFFHFEIWNPDLMSKNNTGDPAHFHNRMAQMEARLKQLEMENRQVESR